MTHGAGETESQICLLPGAGDDGGGCDGVPGGCDGVLVGVPAGEDGAG